MRLDPLGPQAQRLVTISMANEMLNVVSVFLCMNECQTTFSLSVSPGGTVHYMMEACISWALLRSRSYLEWRLAGWLVSSGRFSAVLI